MVFRSDDPSAVIGTPNEIGSTAGRRWVDVPPTGSLWNYLVLGTLAVDQSELASGSNFMVSRPQVEGQRLFQSH